MKLDEEMYSQPNKSPVTPILIGVIGFALLIGLVVLGANGGLKPKKTVATDQNANTVAETVQSPGQTQNSGALSSETEPSSGQDRLELGESHLTAQDLNFWDMYPEEKEAQEEKQESTVVKPKPAEEEEETDPSRDGKHVKVTLDDGSEEWLAINNSLQKNA